MLRAVKAQGDGYGIGDHDGYPQGADGGSSRQAKALDYDHRADRKGESGDESDGGDGGQGESKGSGRSVENMGLPILIQRTKRRQTEVTLEGRVKVR